MTSLDWDKDRKRAYEQELDKLDRYDRRKKLENSAPTKAQLKFIAELRRERRYTLRGNFPRTRLGANGLIRDLLQAPRK